MTRWRPGSAFSCQNLVLTGLAAILFLKMTSSPSSVVSPHLLLPFLPLSPQGPILSAYGNRERKMSSVIRVCMCVEGRGWGREREKRTNMTPLTSIPETLNALTLRNNPIYLSVPQIPSLKCLVQLEVSLQEY